MPERRPGYLIKLLKVALVGTSTKTLDSPQVEGGAVPDDTRGRLWRTALGAVAHAEVRRDDRPSLAAAVNASANFRNKTRTSPPGY
jgi:hypothetical protein